MSEPTREQILSEPAGPRMDAWVTEYVMGVKPRDVRVCGSDEIVTVYNANKSFIDGGWGKLDLLRHGTPPKYSTDIAAAWEVVKLDIKNGSAPAIINNDFGMWAYATDGVQNIPPDGNKAFDCQIIFFAEKHLWCDTAPLAICRAALLATLEE